ncbi:aminotransferase class V-fold PLP-dependent enzyme [Histidinibacterium lentulum]|uniref:Aminotransferase class V-fold PLP-dependent enzyme n=1 Tax=Histidinibacterium lentulum TaxID=2480588 RepID=A0A3N2QMB3_9RHOB|nr:aminotransferase class V-fold PLP-dependent enzyme [Histidinibacterium lentulum]ROT96332.1 aminotransferase class V-fold PLP-dependent enzyme [Histidinibacterium lentulum]
MANGLRDLFLLDEEVTFLNHGSYGACPKPVFARYQEWQVQLERQPVAFLDIQRGYGRWMAETRTALAEELNVRPDDLAGFSNVTHALNVVARSLPLSEGDEILTTDHEYAALEKTWAFVTQRTGARIVVAEVPLPLTSAGAFTGALKEKMTDRTRVLFLSHITSPTALLFPIEEIVAEARRRDIWTVIDGAHSPGQIKLDLTALDADFYAGNCHKWLMSPKGAGFLHARADHQHLMQPLAVSHGWQPDRHGPGPFGGTAFVDTMEMQGTRDPAAWLSVPEALAFRRAHDWWEVVRGCSDLAWETAQRVVQMTGLPLLASRAFCAPQMVSMEVPRCDFLWLHDALLDRHGIEIPTMDWKGRTFVRVSVQGYNTAAEMDLLVEALADVLSLPAAA